MCSNDEVSMEERMSFTNVPVTLDGQPAKVMGYNNDFPIVRSRINSVEFSWPTVKRIIARDRAFKS